MKSMYKYILLSLIVLSIISCAPKWTESENEGLNTVINTDGEILVYSQTSEVKILEVDRFGFKDLNKNNELDAYEDWRLSTEERAKDLASSGLSVSLKYFLRISTLTG